MVVGVGVKVVLVIVGVVGGEVWVVVVVVAGVVWLFLVVHEVGTAREARRSLCLARNSCRIRVLLDVMAGVLERCVVDMVVVGVVVLVDVVVVVGVALVVVGGL